MLIFRLTPSRFLLPLALLLAGACTPQGNAPQTGTPLAAPASVSFMVFGDPAELAAYQGLVDAFEQKFPAIDVEIIHILPFGRYILNSVIVSQMAVPLTIVAASWAGFGMSQLGARARSRLLVLSVGLLMVPITALWLTRFVLFSELGLVDNYAALIAPALMGSSPLFILLFYWTFRRIPAELFESARLEGASALSVWRHIAFPLARATVVAVGILTFLMYWNDFINPLLYLKSQETYTLAVGLQQLQQLDRTNWPLLMAACVIMTAPALLVFFAVQRFFLQESRLSGVYGR